MKKTLNTRDGYRLHFIDTDTDTAYRYQYLSILLSILFGAKRYDVKSYGKFQVFLLLLNFSNCIKVLKSRAVSYFSLCVLFYYIIKEWFSKKNENCVIIYSLSSCFKPG